MPGEPMTDGAIIALSGGTRFRNFTVEQKGGDLVFRLGRERAFIKWPQGKDSLDLALTYTPGRLTYYIDGLLAGDSRDILGDFFHWKPQRLEFGREHGSDRLWMGTIDGVAIFDRVMSAEEIQENCGRYKDAISKRVPAPKMEIDAILQHSSNVPSLDRINPYRDALAVDEYQVQRVLTGDYAPSVIRVVRWAIINGEVLPPPGGIRRLFLEKFSAQSQLQSIYLSDTLNENFALDLYFDLGWPPANTSAGR